MTFNMNADPYNIITKLQMKLEIALFYQSILKNCSDKILLQSTFFSVLQLHIYISIMRNFSIRYDGEFLK